MPRNNKRLRIILLTFFGFWFAYKLYQTSQNFFLIDGIMLLVIACIGFLIFIWSIIKDRKEFKTSKKLISYLPTLVGFFFILINTCIFIYQDNKANSPTLIRGFDDGGFNGFSVDFKTDGNYIMANGSGLGQSYFYGKYTLKDSIITIDKSNIDNCIKTNKLVISTDNYFIKDSIDFIKSKANYLKQIDANGNEINKEFRFRVTVDNR